MAKPAFDTGGTFTDFALLDDRGGLHLHKVLSTPANPAEAVIQGVSELLDLHGQAVGIGVAGLDLAVRVSPLDSSELIATQLAANPRVLCATPHYIRRYGKPARAGDLAAHPCLTLHGMGGWPVELDGKTERIRVSGPFSSSSLEAVRGACLEGAGIALMSYWDVWEALDGGRLERIELEDARFGDLGIWAVYPSRQHLPRRIRTLIDALKARLGASMTA